MENLQDSPATFEENQEYLKDRTSAEGKPYSTKQVAANAAHARRTTLYHKTLHPQQLGRKNFDIDEVEQALKDGYRDTPFIHPRHPKLKIVEETPEHKIPELKVLKAEAEALGIKVKGNWGIKKLKEVIKAA